MKKWSFLYLIMAFAFVMVSCGDEDDNSCDSEDLSGDFNCPADITAVATFCSDGVANSYYTYGGNKYECTGVAASTCDKALQDVSAALIEDGCSSKKSGSIALANQKLSSMAEGLLAQVRSKSLCE